MRVHVVAPATFFLGLISVASLASCSSSEFTADTDGADASAGGSSAGGSGGTVGGSGGASGGGGRGGSAGSGAVGGGAGTGGSTGGASSGGSGTGGDGGAVVDASLSCVTGDHSCDGDKLLGCDESGVTYVVSDCSLDGKICQAGACVSSCLPGSEGCACANAGVCGEGLFCIDDKCQGVDLPPPLAHWPFDGNLNDVSGNGYDGVQYSTVTYEISAEQTAAVFTEGHARVPSLGDTFRSTLDTFTVSLRLRVDAYDREMPVFGLSDSGSDALLTNKWLLHLCGGTYCDGVAAPGVVVETEVGDAGANSYATVGPLPAVGQWVHLVLVVNGSQITYYVDGAEIASLFYVPAQTLASTVYLGGTTSVTSSLNGVIDDIRLYDEVFVDTQVQALASLF